MYRNVQLLKTESQGLENLGKRKRSLDEESHGDYQNDGDSETDIEAQSQQQAAEDGQAEDAYENLVCSVRL